MKDYECPLCGYTFDSAAGDPENGIAPGTALRDLPDGWYCPMCGIGAEEFKGAQKKTSFGVGSIAAMV